MNDTALFDHTFVVTAHASIRQRAEATAPIIRAAHVGEKLAGHMVRGHGYQGDNQWARVKLPSGVLGYVWAGFGQWEQEIEA